MRVSHKEIQESLTTVHTIYSFAPVSRDSLAKLLVLLERIDDVADGCCGVYVTREGWSHQGPMTSAKMEVCE